MISKLYRGEFSLTHDNIMGDDINTVLLAFDDGLVKPTVVSARVCCMIF